MKVSSDNTFSFALVGWPNVTFGIQLVPVAVKLTQQGFIRGNTIGCMRHIGRLFPGPIAGV